VAAEARAAEQEGRAMAAEARAQAQEERAVAAEARAGEQEGRAMAAEAWGQIEQARAEASEVHARNLEGELDLARQSMAGMQDQLNAITRQAHDWHDQILRLQRSISWRVTAPLRFAKRLSVGLLSIPFLPLLLVLIPYVLARPSLRNRLGIRIKHYPQLRHGLRLFAYKLGLIQHDPRKVDGNLPLQVTSSAVLDKAVVITAETAMNSTDSQNLDHLTPRAREIYHQLVEACKARQRV
jgi:hypothetical protein